MDPKIALKHACKKEYLQTNQKDCESLFAEVISKSNKLESNQERLQYMGSAAGYVFAAIDDGALSSKTKHYFVNQMNDLFQTDLINVKFNHVDSGQLELSDGGKVLVPDSETLIWSRSNRIGVRLNLNSADGSKVLLLSKWTKCRDSTQEEVVDTSILYSFREVTGPLTIGLIHRGHSREDQVNSLKLELFTIDGTRVLERNYQLKH